MTLCVSQFRHVRALCTTCGTSLSQRGQGGVAYWVREKSGCGQLLYHKNAAEQLLESWQQRGYIRTNILMSLNKIFDPYRKFFCIMLPVERTSIFPARIRKIAIR